MTARYLLFSLGAPRLQTGTGHEVRLGSRKHLALLLYLAAEPAPHRRDWLVEFLWPASGERTGRQSLATALSLFRGRLGREVLHTDNRTVQLARAAVQFDVDRLLAGEILGTDDSPAMDLDSFLPDFDIDDAPEFGVWREATRTRLLPKIKAGLLTLMDDARRSGDMTSLARSGERLLAIDDLAEEGIRAQMEVSAFAGDRLTAIRVYDAWSQRLLRELGATPSRQLDAMATRLRRRNLDRPGGMAVREVRTEEWRNRAFCGRTNEYRAIYNLWEQAKAGQPGHVLLIGESGIGKTTLVDRLATSLAMEGAVVTRSRCFELERGIPYAALASGLGRLIDQPGAAATSPGALAEIARLVPEARVRFPDLPTPIKAPGESAQIQFAEAVLELLDAVLDDQPVVWLVDDFHIADEASLTILHMIVRRVENRPFLTLLTAHPHLPPGGSAARIRDGADGLGITEMELGAMPPEEVSQLLDALVGGVPVGPGVVERKILLRTSGGHPRALEHLVADWSERGEASLALSMGAMTRKVAGLESGALGRMTGLRSDTLTPVARLLRGTAAILDRRMGELELYRLVGISVPQALAAIEELVSHGILMDTGGSLEFASPMSRAAAYLEVPAILRQVVHAQVADILLERTEAGEQLPGLEVAWHCVRGDRPHRVAPFLLRGAKEAMTTGAPHEADLALRSGAGLVSGADRSRLLVLLSKNSNALGQWQEALNAIAEIGFGHSQLGVEAGIQGAIARHRLGRLELSDQTSAVGFLAGVIRDKALSLHVRLEATAALAAIAIKHDDGPDWRALLETLAEVPDTAITQDDEPALRYATAHLHYTLGDKTVALSHLRLAEDILAERHPLCRLLAEVRSGIGAVECGNGRYSDAIRPTYQAFEAGERLDNRDLCIATSGNMALVNLRLGNYEEAASWGQKSMALLATMYRPETLASTAYTTAVALALLGNKQESAAIIGQALGLVEKTGLRQLAIGCRLGLADVLLLTGKRHRAILTADSAITCGKIDHPSTRNQGAIARWSAVLAVSRGDPQTCHRILAGTWRQWKRLDTLDRFELLLASRLAGYQHCESGGTASSFWQETTWLPQATVDLLGRLMTLHPTCPGSLPSPIKAAANKEAPVRPQGDRRRSTRKVIIRQNLSLLGD